MNDMDKIPLEDASSEDVRAFARLFLQIEGADDLSIKQLRPLVEKAWPQNFIWKTRPVEVIQRTQPADNVVAMRDPEIEKRAGAGIAPTSSKNDPIVELIIPKNDQPGGKDPVFLNVNGMAIHIARGITQRVPYRYYANLCNAVQRLHNWDERTGIVSSENVMRFPLHIQKMPTVDEIFAFEQRDAELSGQIFTRDQFDARREKELKDAEDEASKSERERARGTA